MEYISLNTPEALRIQTLSQINKIHLVFSCCLANRCIEISGEKLLDFSRTADLLRSHVRQFCPQFSRLIAYKVYLLVAAGSRFLLRHDRRWLKDWLWRFVILTLCEKQ